MFTHKQVWGALDALAAKHGLSVSALAKKAGLDGFVFTSEVGQEVERLR